MSATTDQRPARKPAKQVSPEEYGRFIQGVELRDVLLAEGNAKRLAFPDPSALLGVDIKAIKPRLQPYADGFTVLAAFEIGLTQQSGEDKPELFAKFRVAFDVVYASAESISEELFNIFRQVNLSLNIWPYVRQYVHQQSVLMGIPPLVLPVYRTQ